jgi:ribonuclease BN (tRNA processing enzyme)
MVATRLLPTTRLCLASRLSRRRFLDAVGLMLPALVAGRAQAARRTRLILLGTGGGPRPRAASSGSAQAIVHDGEIHVVDCGDGVARQLVSAGLPLDRIRHVYLTHQHSDHTADVGNLLLLAWTAGLRTRVDVWGPPPIVGMMQHFFAMQRVDIETRIANEGRVPLVPLVHVHELRAGGAVLADGPMRVRAAVVDHPPVVPSFAFRFDGPDRAIVISGDTAPSEALVALARGADVLVHSVFLPSAIDRLAARVPAAARLAASIAAHQTPVDAAGRIAARAGVRTLVLSHLVPPDDPAITDAMWLEPPRQHFTGEIILGRDLLEI